MINLFDSNPYNGHSFMNDLKKEFDKDMAPKEKAEELVKKLFQFNHRVKWDSDNDEWTHNYYLAKECALIAVDELTKEGFFTDGYYNRCAFWDEVKQEIEKL